MRVVRNSSWQWIVFGVLLGDGCSQSQPSRQDATPQDAFVDRTADSGIDFVHHHGGGGRKHLPEINAGAVAVLDYDGDGWLDLLFGQGQALEGFPDQAADFRDRLYRNEGGLQFRDVTAATGATESGYTFHIAAVDFDGDRDPDLYFSNFEENRWLRNDGGQFVDVTQQWGGNTSLWSSAAAFADFDQDQDLDLYVTNYCLYSMHDATSCGELDQGEEWRSYCAPEDFPPAPDCFYRNDDSVLIDVTEGSGMVPSEGSGLGLVISDYDNDRDLDVFVSNDGRPNYLWRNDGSLQFHNAAWEAGVAVGPQGTSEACMGTDFADIEGDGDFDLIVSNFAMETNTLYRNEGGGFFEDQSTLSGLGVPSKPFVGFGCEFFDFDNDADLDVFVANGHVIDNIEMYEQEQRFDQPMQLYVNVGGGKFQERSEELGACFAEYYIGRAVAIADLDNDGDSDVVIGTNNGAPVLLENRVGHQNPWLGIELHGSGKNTQALGARILLQTNQGQRIEEVRGTSSYAAFQDLRVIFGFRPGEQFEQLVVRWPTGEETKHSALELGQYHSIWLERE